MGDVATVAPDAPVGERSLRVLAVCLARYGGTLQCARRLAAGLAQQPDVELAYIGSSDAVYDAPDPLDESGATIFTVPTGRGAMGNLLRTLDPRSYWRLWRFARKFRPDVIHYTIGHAWHFLLGPMLRRCPSVLSAHDPVRHLGEESRFYAALSAMEASLADRIIVLSGAFRDRLERFGKGPDRVSVVHHGELGPADGATPVPGNGTVLFTGRLIRYKGTEVLAEAFTRVLERCPAARLVVAGRGTVTPKLAALADNPNVAVRNEWISDEELYRLCGECDFLALPYLEATQSGVIALAQACGRAVVITRVGGLPEQIVEDQTGLIVPPDDAEALTAAMTRLLEEPQLAAKMGEAAAELYRTEFSWRSLAAVAVGAYRQAIADRARDGRPSLARAMLRALKGAVQRK